MPAASGPDADSRPIHLLGVGAQKAGTTWVQRYLAQAPECEPGFDAEYTIFDCLDTPEHTVTRSLIFERARAELDAVESATPTHPNNLLRLAMMADQRVYYDYFADLSRRPGIRMTLDVTPNYALLPLRRYRQIRHEFAVRGVRAVALFVMRDPVERIWSQVRMNQQRGKRRNPRSEIELVRERYRRPTVEARTRYEHTIERLDEVFAADVHYEFSERLFTEKALRRLCDAAGVTYRPTDTADRANPSPKHESLPDDVVAEIVAHYRATYLAVQERFGIEDLSALWPSARLLD
ncbi:hypothetical protein GCM10023226_22450 [Nocardioides nanhaiensis]|uniref:Sulfotransferase n=1 Tax=Nocardioides nanhaiensis TaxID=1476871 RepID=A0ABP8W9A3_9ACTN